MAKIDIKVQYKYRAFLAHGAVGDMGVNDTNMKPQATRQHKLKRHVVTQKASQEG